jgi:hypothetical protein
MEEKEEEKLQWRVDFAGLIINKLRFGRVEDTEPP